MLPFFFFFFHLGHAAHLPFPSFDLLEPFFLLPLACGTLLFCFCFCFVSFFSVDTHVCARAPTHTHTHTHARTHTHTHTHTRTHGANFNPIRHASLFCMCIVWVCCWDCFFQYRTKQRERTTKRTTQVYNCRPIATRLCQSREMGATFPLLRPLRFARGREG